MWSAQFEECGHFTMGTGRLPCLNALDAADFALARRLGRQLQLRKAGQLAQDRIGRLEELLRQENTCTDALG